MSKNTELELTDEERNKNVLIRVLTQIISKENFPNHAKTRLDGIIRKTSSALEQPLFNMSKAIGKIEQLRNEVNTLKKENDKLKIDYEDLELFKLNIYSKIFSAVAFNMVFAIILKYWL